MRIKHDQVTYDYDMSANTAVVVELEKNFSGSLTIPNTLDLGRDNPVVVGVADNAFKEQTGLRKITLPESVTYIGKSAFYGCKALQSVTIPKNVKRIEFATFQGCGSLSTVVIPEGMEYIAQWAFLACSALESIDIPKTVNEIGESAFSYTGLTAVNIPGNGNTTIGKKAFKSCENLMKVEIGDGVVSINDVTCIQRYLAELGQLEGICSKTADANADKKVDIYDAGHIQMYLAEYDVKLGR